MGTGFFQRYKSSRLITPGKLDMNWNKAIWPAGMGTMTLKKMLINATAVLFQHAKRLNYLPPPNNPKSMRENPKIQSPSHSSNSVMMSFESKKKISRPPQRQGIIKHETNYLPSLVPTPKLSLSTSKKQPSSLFHENLFPKVI